MSTGSGRFRARRAARAGAVNAGAAAPEVISGEAAWELVELAQRGDSRACGHLHVRYRAQVAGFLRSRLADLGTVEDLVHETFARALHGIGAVQRGGAGTIRGRGP
ncbi:RNA polymerase sigma factor [Saccharopolyspora sp. MS10]|uniref:RNA polymerase sigma factor n=1 Tax=Saccharopolyspora sp. MS10 TaxID=3385973 RepID=UPI00399F440B